MTWGYSTTIDIHDCDPDLIRNAEAIRQFVIELCQLIKMKRYGECTVVKFGSGSVEGYSMTQLIETSLISGHFANESNRAFIDIFSCKDYDSKVAAEFCASYFIGKLAKVNRVERS